MMEGLEVTRRAPSSLTSDRGRPPAASEGLGYRVSDLNAGRSEGHLNMRADQYQVGPLGSRTPASPRHALA